MTQEIQLARLYDGDGNTITEWHPAFEARKRAIMFDSYNPTSHRRGTGAPIMQSGSETWARNRDRIKSTADARDACRYDWIGGVVGRMSLYTCGQLHCKSMTGEPSIDEAYDNFFHGWCGDERLQDGSVRCDITGRHRLLKMIQMAFTAFIVDGDYGMIEIDPVFSPTGEYCLQGIEADRIGSPLEAVTNESYIGGVGIDPKTGRVQFYRTYRRTRTGQYVDKQEILPKDFIHVFDPERSDEYRGRTKLLRLLNDLRDIREWVEAEKIAGKTQAQWAALIGVKDPFGPTGPMAWTNTNDAGTKTQDAEWGKILKMAEGENFAMLSPSARPSGAFMAFVQTLIRKMAVSLGLSYGFLWDLATLGGVSQRIEVQSDLRKIQQWQKMLEDLILNRVRQKVIAQGISMRVLPPHPNWRAADWGWGPYITADLGHEMEADVAGLQMGLITVADVVRKYGKTAIETFRANAQSANEAIQIGTEYGLPAESFANGLYPQITQQKAGFNTPTPLPPPPPLSIQSIGDKGVKVLLELLEKVGDGTIDRESAVETAMRTFSISRSEAEKIIPDEPSNEDLNRAAGLTPSGKPGQVVAGGSGGGGGKQSHSNGSKAKTNGSRK